MWTILIFIVIGMVAGWAASLLIRRDMHPTDWGVLFIIGIAGSLHRRHPHQPDHGRGVQGPAGRRHRLDRRRPCVLLWLYTRVQNRGHEKQQQKRATSADGQHRERKGGSKHHTKR